MANVFRRAFQGVVNAIQAVLRWLPRLFGNLSWSPPPWVAGQRVRIARIPWLAALPQRIQAARDWLRRNPRRVLVAGVSSVVLVVAGLGGYLWYQSLPKPVEFSLVGTAPGATALKEDAKPDIVHIDFSGSAARLEQIGKPITSGIKMTPAMAGEWVWANDSRLSFNPKQDWAVDQEYVVEFQRSLFPDHVLLSEYKYRFRSAPFSANVEQIEFYQDPRDPKMKKVVATLRFSHAVDSAELEKRINLRMQGQKEGILGFGRETYPYTVTYDKFKGEAYIHSNPVTIPLKDSQMLLSIDAGVRAAAGQRDP